LTSFERAGPIQRRGTIASTAALGGVLQRACACGSHGGGQCEACRDQPRFGLQTKLAASAYGDSHERAADRIAEQVMSGHPVVDAPRRIARVPGHPASQPAAIPASVGRVLASPGRPLEPALRQDMERRFGHDFSRVRVHSGAEAERSAHEVDAAAYTVGHDIVFGAGRLAPGTPGGRRLMAHELTHVVQQRWAPGPIQRQPTGGGSTGVSIGDIDIKSEDPNCQYQPGEVARSLSPQGIMPYDIERGEFLGIEPPDAVVIADFKVGDGELRPSTAGDFRKFWVPQFDPAARGSLEVVGFSDCVGWESRNGVLREQRARSAGRLLPGTVTRAAPLEEYPVANTSERSRALNRSAIIRPKPQAPPPPPPPRPREATITLEEPPTTDCPPEDRRQLAIAFPAAKLMAQKARAALVSTDKGPVITFLLHRYFGKDAMRYLPQIHAGFSKILDNWTSWDTRFDCQLQTEGACPDDEGFVRAYVRRKRRVFSPPSPFGPVYMCEAAFASGDLQRLAQTVLHELSHRLDNTDDEKYCRPTEGWCEALSTKDAIDNADSYARFARELFNASL
jgi:Domain of unknown function (DUF4157)/Lysine-specific metallo-endopeptidase